MARSPFQARPSSGDLSSPAEIGATTKTPRIPASPEGGEPDADDMAMPTITPEAVNYHTADENCSGCQYMGDDGQCAVLKMPVQDGDHCGAFTAKDEGAETDEMDSAGPGTGGTPSSQRPPMGGMQGR